MPDAPGNGRDWAEAVATPAWSSTVGLSNILAVEKRLIKRELGTVHPEEVQNALRAALGL